MIIERVLIMLSLFAAASAVDLSVASSAVEPWYRIFGTGACVGGLDDYQKPAFNGQLADCEALCTKEASCVAISFRGNTYCELWSKEPQETSSDGQYLCAKKMTTERTGCDVLTSLQVKITVFGELGRAPARVAVDDGCWKIRDRVECCNYKDGRPWARSSECVPAAIGTTLSSGGVCEPKFWVDANAAQNVDREGTCIVQNLPTPPTSSIKMPLSGFSPLCFAA
jgi:hypothetical protein